MDVFGVVKDHEMDLPMDEKSLLIVAAVFLAFMCGLSIWRMADAKHKRSRLKSCVVREHGGDDASANSLADGYLGSKVMEMLLKSSRQIAVRESVHERDAKEDPKQGSGRNLDEHRHRGSLSKLIFSDEWFKKNVGFSGLEGSITMSGYCETKLRLALVFAAFGALVGAVFSTELSLILALLCAVFGWRQPKVVLQRRIKGRSFEMEHHLPEMLDVVALGMRSGLSFDSSIQLYTSHFSTALATGLANAEQKWTSGLETRDEALRKVARSYTSPIFGRVVETIVRSIRFGSSMVSGLEAEGAEARAMYKARREEQVAKAPIKMMVPTGVLILPAMLILVLGPVLLELMEGGF